MQLARPLIIVGILLLSSLTGIQARSLAMTQTDYPAAAADNSAPLRSYSVKVISQPRDPYYVAYVWVTILATLVNGGIFFIIMKQGVHIESQTAHMKESVDLARASADAALLNAMAIINAERPWLIHAIERTERGVGAFDQQAKDIQKRQSAFTVTIHNRGRTPAELVTVFESFAFTKKGEELPEVPDYGCPTELRQQRILSPNEPAHALLSTFTLEQALEADFPSNELQTGEKWCWRYGHVIYKNVIDGKRHETRFCYIYLAEADSFIISGPPEYSRHT